MSDAKPERWLSLEITVIPEASEAVEFALNSLDALGTAISFRRIGQTKALTVTGYFNELPDQHLLQDELHYALRSYGFNEEAIVGVQNAEIENSDWLAEWKKHWKPTMIGRFVIAPPWAEVNDSDKIVIRIEPNMAFGTGTHETTQLCINAIDRLFQPDDSFLDVGTGTGILAIAAAKLSNGDEHFFAIDTDPDSVKIAVENAIANDIGFINFAQGELDTDTPQFDFVCANLTIDVILPILDLLIAKTGTTLVMSGILAEQELMIAQALTDRSVDTFKVDRSGEWISVKVSLG